MERFMGISFAMKTQMKKMYQSRVMNMSLNLKNEKVTSP